MRHVLLAFALFLAPAANASAQMPRDVLLDVCNDTTFAAAVAAAYPTTPDGPMTLRAWFAVQPGSCLEGAVTGVVGTAVDLHVMSGEWHWPATDGDVVHCVPATGGMFIAASPEPDCPVAQDARSFRRVPVEVTARRGSGGVRLGRVSYRIDCDAQGDDSDLCDRSPPDSNGFAQPVRSLEFCNTGRRPALVHVGEMTGGSQVHLLGAATVPADACWSIYRGHPYANMLVVAESGRSFASQDGTLCIVEDTDHAAMAAGSTCSAGEPAGFQFIEFRDQVSRFTMYPGQN